MYSITDLLKMAESNTIGAVHGGGSSKYSVSIVNNTNGKRVSLSKALSEKLNLTETAFFLPVESAGELIISSVALGDRASTTMLSGKDKKICYNAALVTLLTDSFKLDFSTRTSCSFNEIKFDTVGDATVAIVKMTAPSEAETNEN